MLEFSYIFSLLRLFLPSSSLDLSFAFNSICTSFKFISPLIFLTNSICLAFPFHLQHFPLAWYILIWKYIWHNLLICLIFFSGINIYLAICFWHFRSLCAIFIQTKVSPNNSLDSYQMQFFYKKKNTYINNKKGAS